MGRRRAALRGFARRGTEPDTQDQAGTRCGATCSGGREMWGVGRWCGYSGPVFFPRRSRFPMADDGAGREPWLRWLLPGRLLRVESAVLLATLIWLYDRYGGAWWLFALLFLVPDLSAI